MGKIWDNLVIMGGEKLDENDIFNLILMRVGWWLKIWEVEFLYSLVEVVRCFVVF